MNQQHLAGAGHQEQESHNKANTPLLHQKPNVGNLDDSLYYNSNEENPKTTKIVRIGSILLLIGTTLSTMFLLADMIGGATFYKYYKDSTREIESPHNPVAVSLVKFIMLSINAILLIMAAIFGLFSTNERNSTKSKFSLLQVIFTSLGLIVFFWEIIFIHVSFFTTGYDFNLNSYGHYFLPFLIIFTLFASVGLICCGICCVSGVIRYRNINSHTREVHSI